MALKWIKKGLLILLKMICFLGAVVTFLALFVPCILIILKIAGVVENITHAYRWVLYGLPFIFFAWLYGIIVSGKYWNKYHKYMTQKEKIKYGKGLGAAINNTPKWISISVGVLCLIIVVACTISVQIGLPGIILPIFNYIAFLIYISSILKKNGVYLNKWYCDKPN